MRSSIIYFILGLLFVFLAIRSVEDSVWNVTTILFAVFATIDFGIAFRSLRMYLHLKEENKKK